MRGFYAPIAILGLLTVVLIGGAVLPVQAQTQAQTPTCPAHALLSIARAGAACVNLDAGMACYGSGSVASTPAVNSSAAGLVQLGDKRPLRDLASVVVSPDEANTETVSLASLAIRISPRATDVVDVLLIEDAELINEVAPPVELTMQAVGALRVHAAPSSDAAVIANLSVNNSVIANGRSDGWLRVTIPATGAVGWASAALLAGDARALPAVEPGAQVAQPFQIVTFRSNGNPACGDLLPAGALLQTPSTEWNDAVLLTINDASVWLAGTIFIGFANEVLNVTALDGVAMVVSGGVRQFIPAGGTASVTSGTVSPAIPYDASLTTALPINNLPRRFQVTPPQTQAAIDARITALTVPTPTVVPVEPTPSNVCRRTIGHHTTAWSGPGEDYEALTQLDAGTAIRPQLATTNPRGEVWWQLADSSWIARSDVVERGDCSAQVVPSVSRVAAPPTNTYSMERCASNNGPVRSGQRVTFEFIPPAWDNLGEATAATRTDPGHFEINGRYYYASSSAPFRLGETVDPLEDRYLRRFTLVWTAEPGTYRITGDWLSYEPSCNLTVPVE